MMTLYWCRPGGIGFGSKTERTESMYAIKRSSVPRHQTQTQETHSPLLAFCSVTLVAPGSAELQYKVLVYGCTQKNLLCLRSPWPFPIVFLVYLYKNSPIIVCVIAWIIVGSVELAPVMLARVVAADVFA